MADDLLGAWSQDDPVQPASDPLALRDPTSAPIAANPATITDSRTPDEAAQERSIGDAVGQPAPAVSAYRSVFERAANQARVNQATSTAPRLRAWINQPNNYAVAHDDAHNLSFFENLAINNGLVLGMVGDALIPNPIRQARAAEGELHAFHQGQEDVEYGRLAFAAHQAQMGYAPPLTNQQINALDRLRNRPGADDWGGPFNPPAVVARLAPQIIGGFQRGYSDMTRNASEQWNRDTGGDSLTSGPFGAGASTNRTGLDPVRHALTRTMALGTSGLAGFAGAYGGFTSFGYEQETGQAYDQMVQLGIEPHIAAHRAEQYGIVATGIEMFADALGLKLSGISRLALRPILGATEEELTGVAGHQLFRQAAERILSTAADEGGEEGAQQLAQDLIQNQANQESGSPGADVTPTDMLANALQSFWVGAQGGLGMGAAGAAGNYALDSGRIQRAQDNQQVFAHLATGAKNSVLRERLPSAMADAVNSMTAETPVATVRIDARAFAEHFNQAGVNPEVIAQQVGVAPETLSQALASGGDIEISTGQYAAHLAASDHHNALVRHARLRPDDYTQAELDTAQNELQSQAHDIMRQAQESAKDGDIGQAAETRTKELFAVAQKEGGPRPEVAARYAKLSGALARTLVERARQTSPEAAQQTEARLREFFDNKFDIAGPARTDDNAISRADAELHQSVARQYRGRPTASLESLVAAREALQRAGVTRSIYKTIGGMVGTSEGSAKVRLFDYDKSVNVGARKPVNINDIPQEVRDEIENGARTKAQSGLTRSEYTTKALNRVLESAEKIVKDANGRWPAGAYQLLSEATGYTQKSLEVYMTWIRRGDLGEDLAERARNIPYYEKGGSFYLQQIERMMDEGLGAAAIHDRLNGLLQQLNKKETTRGSVSSMMSQIRKERRQSGQNGSELLQSQHGRPDPVASPTFAERTRSAQEKIAGDEPGRAGSVVEDANAGPVQDGEKPDARLAQEVRDSFPVSGIRISTKANPDFGGFRVTYDTAIDPPIRLRDALEPSLDRRYNANIDFDLVLGGKRQNDPSAPEARRDGVYIRWTAVPDALRNSGLGTWLYRQLIDWAHRQGLDVYSDISIGKSAWKLYTNRLPDLGYEVQQINAAAFDAAGQAYETYSMEPAWVIRQSGQEAPYEHAPIPRNDYQIDGPTIKERMAAQEIAPSLAQDDARGSIYFKDFKPGEMGSALIRLGESSDLSTFLHEFGHLAHLTLESLATAPGAPEEFSSMWSNTLNWWGVSQEQWDALSTEQRTPYFEQWARTFEAYLMEGQAPSFGLREAFATFKAWLTKIYQSVLRLDHNLNPEIRDVFDRLLATDREIAEARAESGADRSLTRESFAGGEDEWQAYQTAVKEAKDAEEAELRARAMDTYSRRTKRWWRAEREVVRPEATRAVDSSPARRAADWLGLKEWKTLPETGGNEEGEISYVAPPGAIEDKPENLPEMALDPHALAEDYADVPLPVTVNPRVDADTVLTEAMQLKRAGKSSRALRLAAFIRANGGIRDDAGTIKAALGSGRMRPGLINNQTGKTPEELMALATAAGYFGSAAAREGGSKLNQFAGWHAGTANMDRLQTARQMERAGKNRGLIWQNTGWARGLDGEWRFEVSDADLTVPKSLSQIGRRKTPTPLAEILNWPSLFRAYPSLEDITVEFTDSKSEGGSYWHEGGEDGQSVIFLTRQNSERMLSTLRHEIQHAIQRIEGWPAGHNKDLVRKGSARWKQAVQSILEQQSFWRERVRGDAAPTEEDIKNAEESAAFSVYANEMGEIEARDVQERHWPDMTPEERAALPPNSLYDVYKRDKLIWRAPVFGGMRSASDEFDAGASQGEQFGSGAGVGSNRVVAYRGERDRSNWESADDREPSYGAFYAETPEHANTYARTENSANANTPAYRAWRANQYDGGRVYRDTINTEGFETVDFKNRDFNSAGSIRRLAEDAKARGVPGLILENVMDRVTPIAKGARQRAQSTRQYLVIDRSRIETRPAHFTDSPALAGTYADRAGGPGNVRPVLARMGRVLHVEESAVPQPARSAELIREARAKGYNSVEITVDTRGQHAELAQEMRRRFPKASDADVLAAIGPDTGEVKREVIIINPKADVASRSLAARVFNAPPAPIERAGDMLRLGDDRGVLQARVQPTNSVIKVDALGLANEVRGTMGPRIIRALLDEADKTGRVIVSDTRLSGDAVRAVESLRRLGLTVTKSPDFQVAATGSHISGNGPLYVITRGPAPGWSRVMDAYFEPNVALGQSETAPLAQGRSRLPYESPGTTSTPASSATGGTMQPPDGSALEGEVLPPGSHQDVSLQRYSEEQAKQWAHQQHLRDIHARYDQMEADWESTVADTRGHQVARPINNPNFDPRGALEGEVVSPTQSAHARDGAQVSRAISDAPRWFEQHQQNGAGQEVSLRDIAPMAAMRRENSYVITQSGKVFRIPGTHKTMFRDIKEFNEALGEGLDGYDSARDYQRFGIAAMHSYGNEISIQAMPGLTDGQVATIKAVQSAMRRNAGSVRLSDISNASGESLENPEALRRSPAAPTTGGGELKQSATSLPAPVFRSEIERSLERSTTARASAQQWLATIQKTPGVKREEIDWIGLPDFLKAQTGQVSREELLAFVRANGVKVEETVLGELNGMSLSPADQRERLGAIEERDRIDREMTPPFEVDPTTNRFRLDRNQNLVERQLTPEETARNTELQSRRDELQRQVAQWDERVSGANKDATKWSQYTLPGGEGYRELLLRLPEGNRVASPWVVQQDSRFPEQAYWRIARDIDGGAESHGFSTEAEAQAAADRRNADLSKQGTIRNPNDFRSSHWDQPNIIAHVRFNERTDANGKRTLFMEELQSDWHQAGRERGYTGPIDNAVKDLNVWREIERPNEKKFHAEARRIADANRLDAHELIRLADERRGFNLGRTGVPNAPFKNNAWASLAIKRMIRWASEQGFEQIAWIQGQHAVDRFSLGREMRRIYFNPETKEFIANAHGGGQHREQNVSPARLSELIGKEGARQLLEAPINKDGEHEIAAGDIKVGGEGMRAFYDKILPNIANDIGKKFGAKVGETQIETGLLTRVVRDGNAWSIHDGNDHLLATYPTRDLAEKWNDKQYAPKAKRPETVHSLPITPEMRNAVMGEGQSLFQPPSDKAPTLEEFMSTLIADLKGERRVYSAKDKAALAQAQNLDDARAWFEAHDIDLSKDKEAIRAQIVTALESERNNPNAMHPDDIAPWFGFSSGDELVHALSDLKPRAQAIEDRIDAQLEAEHGDIMKDGKLKVEAEKAAHADAQARQIELELAAIEKVNRGRVTPAGRAAKAYAQSQVQSMPIRQVRNYESYLASERRAARAALKATTKGDMREAALQKQKQLVSFWLYRFARDASDNIESIQNRWKRYSENVNTRKAIGLANIEQIDAILDTIEVGRPQQQPSQSLDEWADNLRREEASDMLVFDPAVVEQQIRIPLASMVYNDLLAINDVLRNIETIGRGMVKFRAGQEAQRIADIQAELKARLTAEWGDRLKKKVSLVAPDLLDKAQRGIVHAHAMMLKMDYLARLLDGLKDGGPFMHLMGAMAQEAENDLHDRSKAATRDFLALVRSHYSDKEFQRVLSQRVHIAALDDARTKAQLISYALNVGNEYNRNALLKGEGWDVATLNEALSSLTANDWGFVQSLWDFVAQWKEERFALDERTRGVRPVEVQPTPFTVNGQTYPGGYWPVQFDSQRSDRAAQREAKETVIGNSGGQFRQPSTNRNALKGRVGTGGQALSSDFMSVIAKHVHDSLRDITHRDLVITLRKVKADTEMRNMIARIAGRDAVRAVDEWTNRLAAITPLRAFGEFNWLPAYLRRTATNAQMGFKVSVATMNMLGHLQAIPRNGVIAQLKQAGASLAIGFPDLLRRHLQAFALRRDAEVSERVAMVYEKSGMMRQRREHFDRDISEVKGDIVGRREGQLLPKQFEDALQILNANTDQMVSIPTWLAAYESAISEKVDGVDGERAAIEYADSVVRMVVSAGSTKDLAAIAATNNQFQKLATMFFGWASTYYNQLTTEQLAGVTSGKISPARFMANMVWIWLLPAVISTIFYGQNQRNDGEDDDDYWRRMALLGLIYPLQTIPVVRDAMSAWVQGYSPQNPITSVIDRGSKFASAVDRGDQRQMVKQGYLLASQLTGVPAQAYTTGDFLADWAQGEEHPEQDPLDATREALLSDTR